MTAFWHPKLILSFYTHIYIYSISVRLCASSGYIAIAEDPATIATFQSTAICWATHLISLQGRRMFRQRKHHCSWHPKWYFMHSQDEVIFYHFIVWPERRVVVLLVLFGVWPVFELCMFYNLKHVVFQTIGACVFGQSISGSFRINHRDGFYMVHASDESRKCFGCGDIGHKWIALSHITGRKQNLPLVWWPGWPPDQWQSGAYFLECNFVIVWITKACN